MAYRMSFWMSCWLCTCHGVGRKHSHHTHATDLLKLGRGAMCVAKSTVAQTLNDPNRCLPCANSLQTRPVLMHVYKPEQLLCAELRMFDLLKFAC